MLLTSFEKEIAAWLLEDGIRLVDEMIDIIGVSSSDKRGGAKEYIFSLTRAGTATGIDGVFIEAHPDCDNALCDAASMLPLDRLEDLLKQVKAIDEIVKPIIADDELGL